MSDTWISHVEPVEVIDSGGRLGEHMCQVCGTPTYRTSDRGRWPSYCPEHKSPGNRNTGGSASRTPGKGKSKERAATEGEWNKFYILTLIIGTYLVGRFAAGGSGLFLNPPPGMTKQELDELANDLGMEREEAEPIAKILAQKTTPTKVNKRVGKYVVNVLDYEEVGEALWSYGKRIAPVLAERMSKHPATAVETARTLHVTNLPRKYAKGATNGTTPGQVTPVELTGRRAVVADANRRARAQTPVSVGDDEGTS